MKVRLNNSNNMPNMDNLKELAQKAQHAQEELDTKEYTASSGGEAVKVIITGKPEVKYINIKPEVIDLEDLEILSDMIKVAINSAINKSLEDKENVMQSFSGSFNIPGFS
ncbi:MAG: YbaB/EbfC family nucleoid-associated protein [Candidatus Paraimprobicoccus trichonymphae]|uniref:Nucleoid-associated protein RsTaC01_1127 n=1 Tax=Candidatus Paraimprobicoccus trichonymphae TaxID=3033793 RepID=A0AA48HXE9_9FIRM|nr:MAG: YbaB/EbfC family nucleoid-associated protein [Candidatus Paraimprobicoccus trichonymphae]